jgi:hypothetical protein
MSHLSIEHPQRRAIERQRDTYRPMVSESTLRDMAVERVSADTDALASFIELACSSPCELEASDYFGPISTRSLVVDVLMKPAATDEQIAAGWKLLRARFLADQEGEVARIVGERGCRLHTAMLCRSARTTSLHPAAASLACTATTRPTLA